MKKIVLYGLASALGEAAYVMLVALFMMNAGRYFGDEASVVAIAVFLMIFVLSAAVSGALILGRPVLLYLEGQKKEAVKLFTITLAWMLIFLAILLVIMANF
jgi:hypothetical protein